MQYVQNEFYTGKKSYLFTKEVAKDVLSFHQRLKAYTPTPLIFLDKMAQELSVKNIYIKDESYRFGLNAFKGLGGSYALANIIAEKCDVNLANLNIENIHKILPEPIVFITATAGNHGAGVAWAVREMGQKAIVYMPKNASSSSVKRIHDLGAQCFVTDLNYDDTVRLAAQKAHENGWCLIQDTAWEGYEKIPTLISQGYMTMAVEVLQQIEDAERPKPTHVFLQAGVGAMAGGILGYLSNAMDIDKLTTIITEPAAADCLFQSIQNKKNELVAVDGELSSIMAGLACGEVNPVTWQDIKNNAKAFIKAQDDIAMTGIRVLGRPLIGDEAIVSGPSGALNMGILYAIMTDEHYQSIRQSLALDHNASILIFSTEGATNPELYQKIVG